MDLDLTPSTRSHGAQRMITATVLVCEALVVFFAVLVAHQLAPDDRSDMMHGSDRPSGLLLGSRCSH